MPNHVAFITKGNLTWANQHSKSVSETYRLRLQKVLEFVEQQVKNNIPIFTFDLFSANVKREADFFSYYVDELVTFFENLKKNDIVNKNKIKISVFGKWYNMPGRVVDAIKSAIEETKDYDGFFLNLCINYDGQEEIVDACRVIALKVRSGKLDPEGITKEELKENLYSSYFLPPDMIIVNDGEPLLSGFLLWDSVSSQVCITGKLWPEFTAKDFLALLKRFEKDKEGPLKE